MSEPKFQVDDKVYINIPKLNSSRHLEQYEPYENEIGIVTKIYLNPFGTGKIAYEVKFTAPEPMIAMMLENELKPEIPLTSETDAVFRDILRGI